jgi:metallophosphoesterase (TIGR00282 family)
MRIFYAAELVGKAGISAFKRGLPLLRKTHPIDFVIAGGNGATGGAGLGKQHAGYLRKLGADCVTLGDYCFLKKDLTQDLSQTRHVLRPANLSAEAPGYGQHIFRLVDGTKIGVAVLLGQSGFIRMHGDNYCAAAIDLVERLKRETPFVFIDFHAEASAEKRTLFSGLAGKCSALIGSHTRVQTADEQIRNGTAYITDAGRSGYVQAVWGMESSGAISGYMSGIPEWRREVDEAALDDSALKAKELQGVYIVTDGRGKALSIERIKLPISAETADAKTD